MSAMVFLDTETTGLSLDDDIWEFAAIRREADGTQTEHHMFIEHDAMRCANLPESFRADHRKRYPETGVLTQFEAAYRIHALLSDRPHVVGAVPNFDTERLVILLGKHGYTPGWHYHLIDIENLAVGYLAGVAGRAIDEALMDDREPPYIVVSRLQPPWNSDDLSRAVGVDPPGDGERHTALGDARWAMAVYDAIMRAADPGTREDSP